MDSEMKQYLTADSKTFKTFLDIGDVNPKDYDLEILERAEGRVIRGTNKTLRTAINSIAHLKKGARKKVSSDLIKETELDQHGLNVALYSEQQILYIQKKIEEFKAVYDHSTPFFMETIIEMAKNRLKTAEIEAKMLNSDEATFIDQKVKLRKEFSDMAKDLDMLPKKEQKDLSKNRNSFAEMVLRYEARQISGKREVTEETEKMRKRLSEIRAHSKDGRYDEGKV